MTTPHIKAVNALIPLALEEAEKETRKKGEAYIIKRDRNGNRYYFYWHTYYFHRAMNKLAFEKSLRPFK